MKAFSYKLGSTEAMRMEVSVRDPREDEPDYDCEKCHDTREVNGETCPACCAHDEHDHGICLECKADIFDNLVAAAEFRADCINDR